MERASRHHEMSPRDGQSPYGLEVYTADGQLVGRIAGYVDLVPEDKQGLEEETVDTLGPQGEVVGPRRLWIDGRGYVTQTEMAIPEDQVEIDLRGRRATLLLTLAQLRALPQHERRDASAPPLNTGLPIPTETRR